MITTLLTLLAVGLHPGQVVSVSGSAPLSAAGRLDWVLQDRNFAVAAGTRAVVARVAPDGFAGVVEVKVADGTDRLGWIEETGLAALPSATNDPAGNSPTKGLETSRTAGGLARKGTAENRPRKGQRPNFARLDTMMASALEGAAQGQSAGGSCGSATMPQACDSPIGVSCGTAEY